LQPTGLFSHIVIGIAPDGIDDGGGRAMVIVQGTGRVDPALREQFLAQRAEAMQTSRAESGCLEYVFAADPIEADRVILSERWETQEHLNAHIAAMTERRRNSPPAEGSEVQVTLEVTFYDVSSARSRP